MATGEGAIVKKILLGIVVVLVAIQLVPVDRENPAVVSTPQWDSPRTEELARRACFDCHSNETKWPWYSYLAPMKFIIADHVEEGRDEFNISEYKAGDGSKAARLVERGKMPLAGYVALHPEADLSDAEKKELIDGLKATFKKADKIESEQTEPEQTPEKTE
jgi:mono/diheme cytochrome c family protein